MTVAVSAEKGVVFSLGLPFGCISSRPVIPIKYFTPARSAVTYTRRKVP
jgi:hypothetical protein